MFFRITGLLWILLGIWWIMRPQGLKRRFRKKARRTRRRILLLAFIIIIGLFLSAFRHAHGLMAHAFLILGILAIIKGLFLFTSKAQDMAIEWWLERPLWVWRLWAAGMIAIGVLFQKI